MSRAFLTRILLLCGVVGPPIFMVVFLVEGALRPDYDAWRTTISTLGWGPRGWVQRSNFEMFGLLLLGFSLGVRRVLQTGVAALSAPVLLALMGFALITAGVFVTDPILGYPPGYPSSAPPSLEGTIHNLASLAAFVSCSICCFRLGARFARDKAGRGWALYSRVSGALILVFLLGFFASVAAATHASDTQASSAGLLERICTMIACVWLALVAWMMNRQRPSGETLRRDTNARQQG